MLFISNFVQLLTHLNNQDLKKEQKFWLTKRDNYFKKTFNEFKKNNPDKSPYGAAFGVQDDAMTMFDNNAKFVKDRILFLLNRLNK